MSRAANGKPLKVLLPVQGGATGGYFYFYRLMEGLRSYTDCSVDLIEFDSKYELAPFLARLKFDGDYDIVCANSPYAFAFRRAGRRLVAVDMHSVFDNAFLANCSPLQKLYYKTLIQPYTKISLQRADHVVCVSKATLRQTSKVVVRKDMSVIHPWIDLEKFNPGTGPRPPHGPVNLLCVGSLSRRKGSALLPRLARLLGDEFTISCVTKDVHKWFDDAPNNLVLKGRVPENELIDLYRQADAVLTTSLYEGFGYTLLEGAACGKPTIAFDLEVFREVLPPEGHRYLATPNDVEALAERCRQLALDRGSIDGQVLRTDVERRFNPEKLANDFLDLFRAIQ